MPEWVSIPAFHIVTNVAPCVLQHPVCLLDQAFMLGQYGMIAGALKHLISFSDRQIGGLFCHMFVNMPP
jgi:hypothetical protein